MTASGEQEARPDERHSGAQKVYFACFTEPITMSPEEMHPFLEDHKAWLKNMEALGAVFLGGPFLDDNFRYSGAGLIVLRARSFAEARSLADADPFHANGIRKYRLVPWQVNEGSVALRATLSSLQFTID